MAEKRLFGDEHCTQCGIALTEANVVEIVIQKKREPLAWESQGTIPVHELMCRKCAGIPEDV